MLPHALYADNEGHVLHYDISFRIQSLQSLSPQLLGRSFV